LFDEEGFFEFFGHDVWAVGVETLLDLTHLLIVQDCLLLPFHVLQGLYHHILGVDRLVEQEVLVLVEVFDGDELARLHVVLSEGVVRMQRVHLVHQQLRSHYVVGDAFLAEILDLDGVSVEDRPDLEDTEVHKARDRLSISILINLADVGQDAF